MNIVHKELTAWNHKETNAKLCYKKLDHHLLKFVDKKAVDYNFQVSILNEFKNKGEMTITEEKGTKEENNRSNAVTTDPPDSPLPVITRNIPPSPGGLRLIKSHLL